MTQSAPSVILDLMPASTSSAEELKALNYLNETRDGVISAVEGLSEAQWNFKPAPERWSIAEAVQHLALIEGVVKGILDRLSRAPAPAPGFNTAEVDAMILARVPDRSAKFEAPPLLLPANPWTPAETLERFAAARRQIAEALGNTPELRGHVVPHPILGPFDGYEWILAVAAHSVRHTEQILEVKADPRFPR